MSNLEKKEILLSLSQYKIFFESILISPDRVLKDIINYSCSNHMVFPCNTIELRGLLSKNKVNSSNPIPFFSLSLAQKYLKDYSIFLSLDVNKIAGDNNKFGGIFFSRTDCVDFKSVLYRILVNKNSYNSVNEIVVKNILKDFDVNIECLVLNNVY